MASTIANNNCELCHKNFSRKSSLNRHVTEQHLEPKSYHCKQCGKRFSKKYNLQVHIRCLHAKNRKQITCPNCRTSFSTLATFNKHVESCKVCLSSRSTEDGNEVQDAKAFAETVLKELKQLQRDIQTPEGALPKNFEIYEPTDIEKCNVENINIKDNLYPSGHFTIIPTRAIKRLDGVVYLACEFCDEEFKKKYNYIRHRRIHTKERPFVCILCKKSFPTTAQLKAHCSTHKLDDKLGYFHKFYKCSNCRQGFSSVKQFDNHLSSIFSCSAVTFKCPQCSKSFQTLKTLLSHSHPEKDNELEVLKAILPRPTEVILAKDKSVLKCKFCGVQVHERILLKQHEKRHENLFKNQCAKCPISFASQCALKIHAKVHTTKRIFKCFYCDKYFSRTQSCRRHMLTHLKQLLETHKATQDQTNDLILYPTFIENENGQIKTTTSIIKSNKNCDKKLEETIISTRELKYKCSKCEKLFRYNAWLKKHIKYHHSTDKPYECSNCCKKFRTKQSLENHLLVHSAQRTKTTCQVCAKQYASKKSLRLHLRIHTQEKPFGCDKCHKLFRTSGHLIQHSKANHRE